MIGKVTLQIMLRRDELSKNVQPLLWLGLLFGSITSVCATEAACLQTLTLASITTYVTIPSKS